MTLPKVLVIAFDPWPAPDGKAIRLEATLRALQGRYNVDLLSPKVGDLPHVELRSSARVLRVPLGLGHLHAQVETFARAVRRQLTSEEYRLVHLCDPRVGGPVCELVRERGYRLLYEPLGAPLLDLARQFPRIADNLDLAERTRAAERLCLATADGLLVGTAQARRYLLEQGGFGAKVTVIPGAVDLGVFRPSHGTLLGAPVVAYAGELAPWQGIGTLLRAAKAVLRVRPTTRFSLTGPVSPAHAEAFASLARRLGIEGAIHLAAPVAHSRVPDRLAAAEVCVVPTEADERARTFGPFAVKAAEAMAMARAVVVSRIPSHAEIVSDGDEGCLFPPGDADALAETLLCLLERPDEREALGQRAHARVRESVSHAVFRERLLALYAEILGEGRRSSWTSDSKTVPRATPRG
jgi:glycosyltransferase involved in cell wall biosynthesis